MITKRDIVICIILSIFTCGIYGIIWFVYITDDTGKVSGDTRLSGVKCFLLTLITCGIFGIYWAYLMGKAIHKAKEDRNMPSNDNSLLYLLLSIFGLSIVVYILVQDELNKIADNATI